MKLIVGLGNPGKSYTLTRHNIGFLAVDHLSSKYNIQIQKQRFRSLTGTGMICGHKVLIIKPLTYMNASGEAARQASRFYDIETPDILVVHDDLDLGFTQLKVKQQGGGAGHRGIGSLLEHLPDDRFLRIRVGIGKPAGPIEPAAYVLQKFSSSEQEALKGVVDNIQNCIETILTQGPEAAMNKFHGVSPSPV